MAARSRRVARRAARLLRPPGFRLLALASFWCSRSTYELVLEPIVRDLQEEVMEALAAGRVWKARWMRLRGTWAFWSAVAGLAPASTLKWLLQRLGGGG